jgi:hypothetical protein
VIEYFVIALVHAPFCRRCRGRHQHLRSVRKGNYDGLVVGFNKRFSRRFIKQRLCAWKLTANQDQLASFRQLLALPLVSSVNGVLLTKRQWFIRQTNAD